MQFSIVNELFSIWIIPSPDQSRKLVTYPFVIEKPLTKVVNLSPESAIIACFPPQSIIVDVGPSVERNEKTLPRKLIALFPNPEYSPGRTHTVLPWPAESTPFWIVANGAVKEPDAESLPEVETKYSTCEDDPTVSTATALVTFPAVFET